MHIDVSRAYFHSKAQRPVLIRLPVEDRVGTGAGKIGLMKKSKYGTRGRSQQLGTRWASADQGLGIQTPTSCSQDQQRD